MIRTFFSPSELKINVDPTVELSQINKEEPTKFKPIGIGKPLLIRLHSSYIGDLKTSLFKKKQDILISCTISDDITSEIPAMAVHQLIPNRKDRDLIYPSSRNEGTELIYYSRALDGGKLNINLEIKADRFDKSITEGISNGLSNAAGIPVFLPIAPFLIAGSKIFSIGGSIANKLSEKTPLLSYDFSIVRNVAGLYDTNSGFLVGGIQHELEEFEGYSITRNKADQNKLELSKNGTPYNGDFPYIIISIDGKPNVKYDDFKAQIASTSMMNTFYGKDENSLNENLKEIMEIYNDYKYVKKIDSLKDKLKSDNISEDEKKQIESLKDAYNENIINKDLFVK